MCASVLLVCGMKEILSVKFTRILINCFFTYPLILIKIVLQNPNKLYSSISLIHKYDSPEGQLFCSTISFHLSQSLLSVFLEMSSSFWNSQTMFEGLEMFSKFSNSCRKCQTVIESFKHFLKVSNSSRQSQSFKTFSRISDNSLDL